MCHGVNGGGGGYDMCYGGHIRLYLLLQSCEAAFCGIRAMVVKQDFFLWYVCHGGHAGRGL